MASAIPERLHLPSALLRALAHPLLPCLWLVGIPTLFVAGNDWLADVPVVNADRACLALVAAALAARVGLARPSLGGVDALGAALALHAAVLAVAWVAAPSPGGSAAWRRDGALFVDGVLMPWVAFASLRWAAWTPQRARRALLTLGIGVGSFLAAAGLIEQLTGTSLAPRAFPREHAYRVSGTFSNAAQYGLVASQLFFVCLFAFLGARARALRAAAVAVAGALLFAVLLCRSRSVWLALPVAVAFLAPRWRALAKAVVGAVAIAAALWLVVGAGGGGGKNSLVERLAERKPVESRLAAWEVAASMIASRPFTGFGFGSETFADRKWAYRPSWSRTDPAALVWPGTPHDSLLFLGVAAGLPGIAVGLAIVAAAWRALARARSGPAPQRDLALCVRAAFVALLVNAAFVDIVYFTYAQILAFALIGIVAADALGTRPDPGAPA